MEQLWVPSLPLLGGMMLPLLRHCCSFGSYHALTWRSIFQTSGREHTQIRSWSAQCSANHEGASVSEKDSPKMILAVPDDSLLDARILFCTSPALGHNKEAHPESNKRVPAIIDALDKLELSPKEGTTCRRSPAPSRTPSVHSWTSPASRRSLTIRRCFSKNRLGGLKRRSRMPRASTRSSRLAPKFELAMVQSIYVQPKCGRFGVVVLYFELGFDLDLIVFTWLALVKHEVTITFRSIIVYQLYI
ncbi:unnamed protein product [Urochloa humidicola]